MMSGGGARDDQSGCASAPVGGELSCQKGPQRHVPVLLAEVVSHLAPTAGEDYIDGTFGAGGYSHAILSKADCSILAIDQDPEAITAGAALVAEFAPRLTLSHGLFSQMTTIAADHERPLVNGIVLDIGVSSMQLDQGQRGFSFQNDGPLDMRMAASGPTAADVLANTEESDIADILYQLGEERRSRAIARAIVRQREATPIIRTLQLADLVMGVLGRRRKDKKHPATRTFQALRIYVNDELEELRQALISAEALLKPGGRLVVVTFHSLEDRLVKRFFASRTGKTAGTSRHQPIDDSEKIRPSFRFVNHRPVSPNKSETISNPRARSAKLRAVVRTDAASWGDAPVDDKNAGLLIPRLPRGGRCPPHPLPKD